MVRRRDADLRQHAAAGRRRWRSASPAPASSDTRELLAEAGVEVDYDRPAHAQHAAAAELLELEADYEAARLLTLEAAWMADNSKPNSLQASYAKAKAGRTCVDIALRCVALCGAPGYGEDELLEKWARDAKILDIFEGTQQIQLLIIARQLLGQTSAELQVAEDSPSRSRKATSQGATANAKTRPVAVLGGNRIPFARSNGAYAKASNQDMLTAALDGLVDRIGLAGERLGEVAAGAVLKHSRDFNLTRECVLGTRLAPETPAYDVGQACGTGLETAILVANKIALGQVESAIAGGVDTTSDAPIALNDDLREILLEANRAKSNIDRVRALRKVRPGQHRARDPAQRRAAHRPLDGRAHGDHGPGVGRSRARSRTSSPPPATSTSPPPTTRGFYDDLVTPVPRARARPEPAPGLDASRSSAKLKPVFGGEDGHDDRRQLDAAHRRRLGGAARERGVGGRARPAGAGPLRRRRDRRGRLRRQAARAC